MAEKNKDNGTGPDPSGSPGADDAPGVGRTRQLLHVLHGPRAPEHARLHDEVVRLHLGKDFHPSELIEASIKISPRGFSQQRYGACISWRPDQRGQLAASALSAAPTEAVRHALAPPGAERSPEPQAHAARDAELREWIERSARYFACVAYDFDARLYKLYRFKHRPVHYLEDLDLVERAAELPALAYIRSLELHMDDPEQRRHPLYFKLRFAGKPVSPAMTTEQSQPPRMPAAVLLEPGFTPHPLLAPRVLFAAPDREAVVRSLSRFLADITPAQDPVVKLVPPRTASAQETATSDGQPVRAEDFLALDYGVNVNLLDPERIHFVQDQRDCILGVAEAFGCLPQAESWLRQILPFGCFVSYLGVGPDSVTFYYRSTALHRGKPALHFSRGPRSTNAADPRP